MRGLLAKVSAFFRSGTQVGVDRAGNRYFFRLEEIYGVSKEKRWVIFKGEEDPTSLPVEWISWLNGQRKKAPTPQELIELEARRERIKLNIELLKKEEDEKKLMHNHIRQSLPTSGFSEETEDKSFENIEEDRSAEPTGSGSSFKPGTWQPPT